MIHYSNHDVEYFYQCMGQRTPNAGRNMLFHIFCMKNVKKRKKVKKTDAKNAFLGLKPNH